MIANVLLVKVSHKAKPRWKGMKRENNLWPICNLVHVVISIFERQDTLQAIFLRVSLIVASYDDTDM